MTDQEQAIKWARLTMKVHGDHVALLEELLFAQNALSVAVTGDDASEDVFSYEPNQSVQWDQAIVEALFSCEVDTKQIVQAIESHLPTGCVQAVAHDGLADEDWVYKTQQQFQARCFASTLWVSPAWDNTQREGSVVRIDPGWAFGTGAHETTQLCLTYLAEHPPVGLQVLDYGCGSGLLALAAVVLGAKDVWAVDHDVQAIEATSQNAQLNHSVTADNFHVADPAELPHTQSNLIIANILPEPLIALREDFMAHLVVGGTLVLSGILQRYAQRVIEAYKDQFTVVSLRENGEWVCVVLQLRVT